MDKAGWETLRSGIKRKGDWFVGKYPTGWWRWSSKSQRFGPFETFELAAKGAK